MKIKSVYNGINFQNNLSRYYSYSKVPAPKDAKIMEKDKIKFTPEDLKEYAEYQYSKTLFFKKLGAQLTDYMRECNKYATRGV